MSESDSYESAGEDLNNSSLNFNENTKNQNIKKEKNVTKNLEEGNGWDIDDWDVDENEFENCEKAEEECSEKELKNTKVKKSISSKLLATKIEENSNKSSETILEKPTTSSASSSWVWKPWGGVVSLLSTATEGVTTLSSQVSQGLSSVLENSIGVPNPEELAKINTQQMKNKQENNKTSTDSDNCNNKNEYETALPSLGLGSIVTGMTTIGNKVITGGLDTLEEIGKKTMNILQENDPLLLNKRKLLGLDNEKPILSQALREAKEKSEEIEKNLKQIQKNSYKKQLHFESLFDHYYGLVHLEALEMLSKQSSLKLQSLLETLSGNTLYELEETLNEVKELCDLGETENEDNDGLYDDKTLENKLIKCIEDLNVQINFTEILKCWNENIDWLLKNSDASGTDIYEHGLKCLAETCALIMLKMHKIAEILLVKDHHSTANEVDALVQLTNVFCFHLHGIANRFGSKLNTMEKTEEINSMITSLFVEVFNSTSYVQSAFQLFIPIFQVGAA